NWPPSRTAWVGHPRPTLPTPLELQPRQPGPARKKMLHPRPHISIPEPPKTFTVLTPYPPASKPRGFFKQVEQAFRPALKIGVLNWALAPKVPAAKRRKNAAHSLP